MEVQSLRISRSRKLTSTPRDKTRVQVTFQQCTWPSVTADHHGAPSYNYVEINRPAAKLNNIRITLLPFPTCPRTGGTKVSL